MTEKCQTKSKLIIRIMEILTALECQEYDFDSDTWSHDITREIREFYQDKNNGFPISVKSDINNYDCCGG